MGLFEEAGRRFERFRQQAKAAADGDVTYECGGCGARMNASREHCPECGDDDVVPIETDDDEGR